MSFGDSTKFIAMPLGGTPFAISEWQKTLLLNII
ncbi:hypothetical protein TPS_08201 [Trichinella pseudospiralis]